MISDLESGKWIASRYGRLTPGTHFIGACVGPTGGLGTLEKVYIGSPYRKSNHESSDVYLLLQSLYQLSYPVSRTIFSSCERQKSLLRNGKCYTHGIYAFLAEVWLNTLTALKFYLLMRLQAQSESRTQCDMEYVAPK
jgi:hypothetical protein